MAREAKYLIFGGSDDGTHWQLLGEVVAPGPQHALDAYIAGLGEVTDDYGLLSAVGIRYWSPRRRTTQQKTVTTWEKV